MNLSFKPSHAGICLWWAVAWRSVVVSAVLFVPMFVILVAMQLGMGIGLHFTNAMHPYAAIGFALGYIVLNVFVQWFLLPVTIYAGVFRWLFKGGSFGRYAIVGNHLGQPVATYGKAFKFSAWFFLQNFKYIWPLFFGGIFVGLLADNQGNFPAYVNIPLLLFIPLSIYLYTLILTDLIRRRKFSKLELIVTPRTTTQTAVATFETLAIKPQAKPAAPVIKPVAAPAVKAAPKVALKTVAKPVGKAKPVAKPAAKPAPKPVAKAAAKPAAKAAPKTAAKSKKK